MTMARVVIKAVTTMAKVGEAMGLTMVRDMKAMVKAVMATMTNILPMVAMKKAVMVAMAAMATMAIMVTWAMVKAVIKDMVTWAMVKVAMAAMVTWAMVKVAMAAMATAVTAQAVMAVAGTVKAVITVKREVLWAVMAVMVVMVRAMVAGDLMVVISLLFLALMVTTAEDSRGLSTLLNMDPTAMVAVGDGVDGAASGATHTTTSPGLGLCSTTRSLTMKPITWPIF